jgi:hypothetical protein
MRRAFFFGLVCLACCFVCQCRGDAVSRAAWVSPDKVISIVPPKGLRQIVANSSPPAKTLGAWADEDRSRTFVIVVLSLPPQTTPLQKDIEEGFLEELHGTLVESRTYELGGYTVFRMSARGNVGGKEVTADQLICLVGDCAYSITAMGMGRDIFADPSARDFLASLKILKKAPPAANASQTGIQQPPDARIIAVLVAVIALGSLAVLFAAFKVVVMWREERKASVSAGCRNQMPSIYTILAIVSACSGGLMFLSCGRQVGAGMELPAEPGKRLGYIIGVYSVPLFLLLLAGVFTCLARRQCGRPRVAEDLAKTPPASAGNDGGDPNAPDSRNLG